MNTPPRHVRLFRNGRNQAVRIPRELELPGNEALLRKEGDVLILEPIPPTRGLLAILAAMEPLNDEGDEFPDVDSDVLPLDMPAL